MGGTKLIQLMGIASLAVLACSFGPASVNALSVGSHHLNRHVAHEGIAKRSTNKKRQLSKRCKARPSSSGLSSSDAPAPSSSADWTSSVYTPTSTYVPPPPSTTWTPTTSDTPTPTSTYSTPSAAPTSSGSSKIGIAWDGGNDPSLANFKTDQTQFLYTWSPWKPTNADELGFEFWPMLPNTDSDSISAFQQNVVAGYGTKILGFNEPDISTQSNLDPNDAAGLWMQYIEPMKDLGYELISPAVSSGDSGIPWLQQFMGACSSCTIDACALHYYGTDANDFISYVENFHSTFNCDLHITEFADQNFGGGAQATMDEIWAFYAQVNPWLDSTPYVASYFQFGVLSDLDGVNTLNALMDSNGSPTSLGYTYIYNSWN